jgi:hypothetical protein
MKIWLQFFLSILLLFGTGGCSSLVMNSLLKPTISNLQRQTDLDLVCDGTPAFLLMIDSLLVSKPDDVKIIASGVQAYVAYAAALDACGRSGRSVPVSEKAKQYGLKLLSLLGDFPDHPADSSAFSSFLVEIDDDQVSQLFWGGYGWATWIEYQAGSPESMIDLVKVEKIMLRVVEVDEAYYHGAAHIFLGAYYGSRPTLLGGKLQESRNHFDQALLLNKRQFLPALVAYAETYAKMTFDRQLFASLLQEVLDFPISKNPEQALVNLVAKRNARKLLDSIDIYF